jgi:hypothetical protein
MVNQSASFTVSSVNTSKAAIEDLSTTVNETEKFKKKTTASKKSRVLIESSSSSEGSGEDEGNGLDKETRKKLKARK